MSPHSKPSPPVSHTTGGDLRVLLDLRPPECGCASAQHLDVTFRWDLRFRYCAGCRSNRWLLGETPVGRPDSLLRRVWTESAVEAVRHGGRRTYRGWDSIQASSSGPLSRLTIKA
jgi:hypothetical protein